MSKPHICPLCHGAGKLKNKNHTPYSTDTSVYIKTCHACKGQGIVWEPNNQYSQFSVLNLIRPKFT